MASSYQYNMTNNTCLMLSDTSCEIIQACRRAVSILSMCCCLGMLLILVLFKKYKFMIHRLNMYLTTSVFFQALGFAVQDYKVVNNAQYDSHTHSVCIFEAWWLFYSNWVPFLFICCITFNIIYLILSHRSTARFEKYYLFISLALPGALSGLPFIMSSYGPAGLWCWIISKRDGETFVPGVTMSFVLYYGPLWIIIVAMVIGQVVTMRLHYKQTKKVLLCECHTQKVESFWTVEIKILLFLPWINILGVLFATLNRIRLATNSHLSEEANFFFWFMHAVTDPLHGTLYALVFVTAYSRFGVKQLKEALLQFCTNKTTVKDYPIVSVVDEDYDSSFKSEYVEKKDDG
ncbi:hypothetical protein EMCRGX_G026092 [Ephydatia muelleri]|eukprot:Em0021g837a